MNNLLDKEYKKYIRFPEISSDIVKYRKIQVFVEGAVNNPGTKLLSGVLSFEGVSYFPKVFDAIRYAGGVNSYSNIKDVTLIRNNTISNGGGKIMTKLNLESVINSYDQSQNIRVLDGDIIKISRLDEPNDKLIGSAVKSNLNSRFINILISGRVNFPGPIKIGKSSTLNDALDLAGGTKILKGKIRYISFSNDGSIKNSFIKYRRRNKRGSINNPYLNDGDIIFVGESFLSASSQVLTEITQPFRGIYSTYSLIEAIKN